MVEFAQVLSFCGRSDWQSIQSGDDSHAKTSEYFEPRRSGYRRLFRLGRCPSRGENPMSQRQINPAFRSCSRSRRPGNSLPRVLAGTFRFRVRSFLLSMAGDQSHHDSIISPPFESSQLGRSSSDSHAAHPASFKNLRRYGRRRTTPFFIIDSHPVDVCRPVRAGKKKRLGGLARKGYCASLKRWFHGVREHLIFTPEGRIAFVVQLSGKRHDVNGLYALLKTDFQGHLLGDNAYWPKANKRSKLAEKNITVTADTRSNWHIQNPPEEQGLLDTWRGRVERRIGLFNTQFHAGRTLCRSLKHYLARRWTKTCAHNFSRHLNSDSTGQKNRLCTTNWRLNWSNAFNIIVKTA